VRYTLVDKASRVTGLCSLRGARWACGEEAVFSLIHKGTAKSDSLLSSTRPSLRPSVRQSA